MEANKKSKAIRMFFKKIRKNGIKEIIDTLNTLLLDIEAYMITLLYYGYSNGKWKKMSKLKREIAKYKDEIEGMYWEYLRIWYIFPEGPEKLMEAEVEENSGEEESCGCERLDKIKERLDEICVEVTREIVELYRDLKDKIDDPLVKELKYSKLTKMEEFCVGTYIIHKIAKNVIVYEDLRKVLNRILVEKEWERFRETCVW